MPKQTFLNLSVQKQKSFLRASLVEFANNSYEGASVSKIVKQLGIAKGSVYQYFQDKEDLYAYLLEQTAAEKLQYISGQLKGTDSYEEFLKAGLFHGSIYDMTHPAQALLILKAMKNGNETEMVQSAIAYYRIWIEKTGIMNEVRDALDVELLSHLSFALTTALKGYLEATYDFSIQTLLEKDEPGMPFSEKELEHAVDSIVTAFFGGIR